MDLLPNISELIRYVLLHTDYDTILNYGRTCVEAGEICRDNIFWMDKAQKDFGVSINSFKNTKLSPAQRYLEILVLNCGIAIGAERFISLDIFMARAFSQDRFDLVQYGLELGCVDWVSIGSEYARKGNKEAMHKYLLLSKNYDGAAGGALEGNYRELFGYVRSIAPPNFEWGWYYLLLCSLRSDNSDLVKYVISLIPQNYELKWNSILRISLQLKKLNLFNYLYSSSLVRDPNYVYDWSIIIYEAAKAGDQLVFNYIHSRIPSNYPYNYNTLIYGAIDSGNKQLIDHVYSLAPDNHLWVFNQMAGEALKYGNKQLFDYIRSLAPQTYHWKFEVLAYRALTLLKRKRNIENVILLFEYVRSLAPLDYVWNWNCVVEATLQTRHRELYDYVRSLIPSSYELNWTDIIDNLLQMKKDKNLFSAALKLVPSDYPLNWSVLINTARLINERLHDYVRSLAPSAQI